LNVFESVFDVFESIFDVFGSMFDVFESIFDVFESICDVNRIEPTVADQVELLTIKSPAMIVD
jgi:hypothetical protein